MKNIKSVNNKHKLKDFHNSININVNEEYWSKQKLREKGVTITSLVITIIVLLILAGITIKFALDDNGIIKQSKLASEKYQNKALQEYLALNQAEQEIDKASNGSSSGSSSGGSSGNQLAGGNSTSGGSSEDTNELKKQIEDLQNEVDSLTDQIKKEQQEKEQLQQQVNDLKKQQNEANIAISDLKNQIKDKDNKINDLTKEKESLENQINTLKSKQATGNATVSQVLAGATFSNSSSIGLTGTMVSHSAITSAVSIGSDGSKIYLRTTQGAYLTNSTTGYPEICANIYDINNITGYKYNQSQYDSNYSAGYNAGYNSSSMKNLTLASAVTGGSQWQATGANNKQPITATYTPTSNCNYVIYAVIIQGDSRSDRKKVNGILSAGSSTVIELPNSGGYDYNSERTWIATGHASAGQAISATFTADTAGYFCYSTRLNIYVSA